MWVFALYKLLIVLYYIVCRVGDVYRYIIFVCIAGLMKKLDQNNKPKLLGTDVTFGFS